MNADDRKELGEQARIDGRRLFNVSESLYTILIMMNGLLGFLGGVAGWMVMSQKGGGGTWMGLFIWGFTAVFCTVNYFIAVLSTHATKVLTHTSLATVAMMESRYELALGNTDGGGQ